MLAVSMLASLDFSATQHIFIITSKLSFLYILLILLDHFLNVKCNMS